ncbi:methyltransferase domain-containing protein [Rhodanobacter ginsengisoli]|uniref:Methyltransferase domain-containing protein n=1 Tax=Rhodanobacter ginsengisoli TaxID=418646 RepID=A0ABW0QR51_9GAMM
MSRSRPNSQYNIAKPDSLPVRLAAYQRRRMYSRFLRDVAICKNDSLLDVGVTSDRSYEASNYIEAWYPHKDRVTALGIDDASFLEQQYPGMKFIQASGLDMPFEDRSFDVVHSSAVIEHVGSYENQIKFVLECARVSRKAVFLTTPNRWFPVEFHTVLPLLHWLPKTWFRAALRACGMSFFASEENLNLLSSRECRRIAAALPDFDVSVSSVALGGWPSNLLIIALRRDRSER